MSKMNRGGRREERKDERRRGRKPGNQQARKRGDMTSGTEASKTKYRNKQFLFLYSFFPLNELSDPMKRSDSDPDPDPSLPRVPIGKAMLKIG